MPRTLFFDTETTGLTLDNLPYTDARQPMPVQLGMKLDSETRVERTAANILIRPEGWKMSAKASEITGLTDEIATVYGTHLITAVELFLDLIDDCELVVAHNINFDVTVMRRAVFVYSELTGQSYKDPFEDRSTICTMLSSMNIVKALPKRNGQYKWPKLSEAVKYFFNEELDGAHDALVDVRACARVHYELIDLGLYAGEYKFQ
jgi:DNA polymerase III subunit epsilon